MTTEHKDIEPVAFVMAGVLLNMHQDSRLNRTQWHALLRCTQVDESEVPLYPQSAIDALQAEKAALFAKMDKLEGRAVLAEAQRDELLAAQQWQPIATAPKDGAAVLALIEGSDIPQSVRYRNGGWKVCWDDYRIAGIDGPTHWMPLPAAPAIANAKGAEE